MPDKDIEDIEQTSQFGEFTMAERLSHAKNLDRKTCFVILGGLDVGSVVNIDKSVMLIGRGAGCDLILRNHDISRRHAEVRKKGSNSLVILDLGSTNGTFIGGELITEATLREGEKVLLGRQTVLKFVLMDELEETCQKQIFQSSTRDTLTDVFNRKYLSQKIVSDIALAKRHSLPISLLMVDIDRFKNVNDAYGHSTGDRVLVQVAQAIGSIIRKNDMVARYGGEEFIVVAQGIGLDGGKSLGERIRHRIKEESLQVLDGSGAEIRVTVSIGVVSVSGGTDVDEEILISTADKNLYSAKDKGRNMVVVSEIR